MKQEDWRGKYKQMEQTWMSLKDDYAELARVLGAESDAWFGDPLESHAQVLERAKALTPLKTKEGL